MRRMLRTILLFLSSSLLWCQAAGQSAQPTKVRVNGVNLHYIEQERGEPLILLHGGQGDYRSWGPQVEALSPHYRVISYSRRYNYSNNNPLTARYSYGLHRGGRLSGIYPPSPARTRSPRVGTPAGALTALVLATKHPGMVRSLVLAEPPVLRWAKDDPKGEALYRSL